MAAAPEGQVNGPGGKNRRCTPAGGEKSNQSSSCLAQTGFSSQAGRSAHFSRWKVRKQHQGLAAIRRYLDHVRAKLVDKATQTEEEDVADHFEFPHQQFQEIFQEF